MIKSALIRSHLAVAEAVLPRLPGSQLGWLVRARREALAELAREGLPQARDELWKYTALRSLQQRNFALGDSAASTQPIEASVLRLVGAERAARLVFVNGVLRAELSSLHGLPEGVSLVPSSAALAASDASWEFALARAFRGRGEGFSSLNAAFASEGAVLRVAEGVALAAPVHLLFIGSSSEGDCAWHVRNLIDLGRGARAALIEQHVGVGAHRNLATVVNQWRLAAESRLTHVRIQNEAADANLIARTAVEVGAAAVFESTTLELGAALSRLDLEVELCGSGARARTRGVVAVRQRRSADVRLAIAHRATATTSDSLWRGVADERGRATFAGAITVAATAPGSDAQLSSKNLLLSPHAEINTRPVLEIDVDEVKASHGATVGQLDERALFYLRSRGIGITQARSMLTFAFCRAALAEVGDNALRETLEALLAAQLPRADDGEFLA